MSSLSVPAALPQPPTIRRSLMILLCLTAVVLLAFTVALFSVPAALFTPQWVAWIALALGGFLSVMGVATSIVWHEHQLALAWSTTALRIYHERQDTTKTPTYPMKNVAPLNPAFAASAATGIDEPPLRAQATETMALVKTLTELTATCTAVLERQQQLLRTVETNRVASPPTSAYDLLTGALSHTALMRRLTTDVTFALKHQQPLALALFDITNFRAVNHTYGYRAGDDVLAKTAAILRDTLQEGASLARMGADQFAVVWSGIDSQEAQRAVEQILAAVARALLVVLPEEGTQHTGETIHITLRAGLALYPDDGTTAQALLDIATDALATHQRWHAHTPSPLRPIVHADSQIPEEEQIPITKADTTELPVTDPAQNAATKQMTASKRPTTPLSYIDAMAQKHSSIQALTAALEAHDKDGLVRARYLAELAEQTALLMNRPIEEARLVGLGALLHDVGNLGIPQEILEKPEALTAEEWAFVRRHPYLGEHLLSSIGGVLAAVASIVASHRERWDGKGYPAGLSGEAIPLGARIVAVCGVYGALISERPYRPAYTKEEAMSELRRHAGTQFDAAVVEAFGMALDQQ